MSQHTSLKSSAGQKRHRNVLKRFERIRNMVENEKWGERNSAYNLPKIKMIKLKVKKVKEKPEEAAAAGGTEAAKPAS